ncbi:histidinol-phosphate transaminase [Acidisphaera sp. S103]|uniref:histidinol-phosphate transaminase n=1 Tax=Acidisphaera sp. S103 TaxID=1747223 RepID=UPI00131A9C10|nr:histidinol-phosphate transaminase [Acidisphaera sp. S103]
MTTPSPRPEILTITAYVAGESELPGANRTIKLSSNEGAFGVPPSARAAIIQAAESAYRYPDGGAERLREAIGRRWGLNPDRIVCGAGSDDLLYQFCLAYGGPGRDIIMSAHGFAIFHIAGTYAGSRVIKVPERNLTADLDAMLAAVSPATRLVFLANPNNPTGSMVPADDVARFRAALPPEVLLVLDSAYAEYVTDPAYDAGIKLVDATDNTVMTRTFSKVFGLGGMRIGWCYAPPGVIDVLNRVRGTFNVSVPAQAAAIAALAEPGWVEKSRTHNTEYRPKLTAGIQAAGLKVWPSEGNFVLVDLETTENANAADAFLRTNGIIVRKVGGYGLPHCLRVTVGTAEEVGLAVDAFTEFMRQSRG